MGKTVDINKGLLEKLIKQGKTFSEIGEIMGGRNYRTISYHVRKLGLFKLTPYAKVLENKLGNAFEKIDTKEKAYILGFILGDGSFTGIDKCLTLIQIATADREILDFMSKVLKAEVREYDKLDRSKRIFPHVSLQKHIPHIMKHLGGALKQDRHFPRVPKQFEHYLVQGFFDADGCISWGRRKDRNRLWANISFTHHLKCLSGLQKLLLNDLHIATAVYPKSGENCYVIKFSTRSEVIKFLDYIYQDKSFIILKRKYEKYKAVRLELGELGETADCTIPSLAA